MNAEAHAASLPVPGGFVDFQPETLVLRDVKIDDSTPDEHISVFGDDRWYLHPMALKPTGMRYAISFGQKPAAFQETMKRLVWCMINLPTPLDMLQRPTGIRSRLTPGTVAAIHETGLGPLTRWLQQQGIGRLCDADNPVLSAYGEYVAAQSIPRAKKAQRLWGVTRIWLLAPYLPVEDRIPQPPWEPYGFDDCSDPRTGAPKTDPAYPSPNHVWFAGMGSPVRPRLQRRHYRCYRDPQRNDCQRVSQTCSTIGHSQTRPVLGRPTTRWPTATRVHQQQGPTHTRQAVPRGEAGRPVRGF